MILDLIEPIKKKTDLMVGAYQVSGEYAMIKGAVLNNWLDENQCIMESLLAINRAGSDIIITYFADKIAGDLK